MYSLDVDLLKNRRQDQQQKETTIQDKGFSLPSMEGNLPLIIGLVVGISCVGGVIGVGLLTNRQTAKLNREISQLEQELSQAQSKQQKVTQKEEELKQAQQNLQALANIFNQIKPVSAILEDVRDRAPDNIQISSLQQNSNEGTMRFNLEGTAGSYESVNHFSLTLQRSPFIKAKSVNLQTAQKSDFNIEFINDPPEDEEELSPKQVVSYSISFEINNKPASELLQILQEKGATGLVTRIQTLEQKGIIQ